MPEIVEGREREQLGREGGGGVGTAEAGRGMRNRGRMEGPGGRESWLNWPVIATVCATIGREDWNFTK